MSLYCFALLYEIENLLSAIVYTIYNIYNPINFCLKFQAA